MSINPNNVRKKLAKNILADGFEPIIDLSKSHGSYLVDQRNDDEYSFVAAWEYVKEKDSIMHKEQLVFENVKLATRSYK